MSRSAGPFKLQLESLEDRTVPAKLVGLDAADDLVIFDSNAPGQIDRVVEVTGVTAGQDLVGIDYRPATGELYAIGVSGTTVSTYILNSTSGAATLVGSATVAGIGGATKFGFDFNPVPDRMRIVTDLASDGAGGNTNNFRMNPNNGALAAIDPDLDFAALPGGSANAPEVAVAYTNNRAGATTTQLFGIVSGGDRLVRNAGAAPGFPTLANVGLLGADVGTNVEFEIAGTQNSAFAVADVAGVSNLYSINLTTGAASLVGAVGSGERDFTGLTAVPTSTFAAGTFESFVENLYSDLLSRSPDAGGFDSYVGALNSGSSMGDVVNSFLTSPEYFSLKVQQYFRDYLNREADVASLDAYVEGLVDGRDLEDVRKEILLSDEYSSQYPTDDAFIAGLYNDLLGRAAGSAEIASYAGSSREEIVETIFKSDEANRVQIASYYANFLDRQADQASLDAYTNAATYEDDISLDFIQREILTSAEYFQLGVGV